MRLPKDDEKHVEINGRRLWTHTAGRGRPTVVFVPGGGGIGLDFALAHAEIAEYTASVVYDRAGTGHSDDIDLPRSAAEVVDELRSLLATLELPGPYVLVGHSLGGAYVQHFAQRHPDEVAGLVLLDPAHEDFDEYMPEHLKIATRQAEIAEPPQPTPELRELARQQITGYVSDWPDPLRDRVVDLHATPDRVLTGFHEGLNLAELRTAGPRPAIPITVLSAAGLDSFQAAFATESDLRRQIAGTERLARSIAATGRPGQHRSFAEQSHAGLPMRRPDAVVDGVLRHLLSERDGVSTGDKGARRGPR